MYMYSVHASQNLHIQLSTPVYTHLMQSHVLVMKWSHDDVIVHTSRQVDIDGTRHLRVSGSFFCSHKKTHKYMHVYTHAYHRRR